MLRLYAKNRTVNKMKMSPVNVYLTFTGQIDENELFLHARGRQS